MAFEVRGLQFSMDENAPDFVVSTAHTVPTTRTYVGVVAGNTGPLLLVSGDWDLTESVTYSWVRRQELPWEPDLGEVACASWTDSSFGFNGIAIEGT
jgi:hypothetical protein